jgi:hypothetical protein
MAETFDLFRDVLGQSFQERRGGSEVFQNNRPWLAVDPAGLDNAPVSMSPSSVLFFVVIGNCNDKTYNNQVVKQR